MSIERHRQRRWRWSRSISIGVSLGLFLTLPAVSPAAAYSKTGCKWSSANVTYFANTTGDYLTAYHAAASGWHATDVNMSHNTSSRFIGTAHYWGFDGYAGWTNWQCNWLGNFNTVSSQLNKSYLDGYNATKKKIVALHEFGHGLGLGHSTAGGWPVMNSCPPCAYDGGTTGLTGDDISGVNSIY